MISQEVLEKLKSKVLNDITQDTECWNNCKRVELQFCIEDYTINLLKEHNNLSLSLYYKGGLYNRSDGACYENDIFDVIKGFDIVWDRLIINYKYKKGYNID